MFTQIEPLLAALRSGDISPVEALEAFQAKALVVDRFKHFFYLVASFAFNRLLDTPVS